MALFQISVNDVGTTITFPLKDSTGTTALDLTNKTATIAYDTYPTASNRVTRSLTVSSPATNGIVTWTLVAGDTATPGTYKADIIITGSGYQATLPVGGFTFDVIGVV